MPLPGLASSLARWTVTLKFKIIALAVATAVLAAMSSTELALTSTRNDLQRLLLENEREDGERTAALLANKLEMLEVTLEAVARQIGPADWQDRASMTRMLLGKPALGALFDVVFAVRSDGTMLARVDKGAAAANLPSVADRPYFVQAMKSDRPVVSAPLLGRVSHTPIVIIAMPVRSADGRTTGVIAGSLALRSARLFLNLASTAQPAGARTLVMDRAGTLLAHPLPGRVLGSAADEPGLAPAFARWRAAGSAIDARGFAELTGDTMVSMSSIPGSDWVLVHLTPQAIALAPLAAAGRTAWRATAGVGFVAALLAGMLAWRMTRPISRLRLRAEQLLDVDDHAGDGWPDESGEIGGLARAFQQVVEQRRLRQRETQALLKQLEAVLDHAEVGIALTRNGHFELVSRHFCRTFRCDKEQLLGRSTRVIYASDEACLALKERARPVFMERGAYAGELELMRHSGQTFWAHMRGRAVVPGDRSQGTIWTVEDVTEVREQRERLAWASSHDSLTGLANRAAFEVLLENASARADSEPFCALFIDLDRFKQVNDTGGHAAGDALLRDVAQVLADQVRKSDTVARLGGDEFAVLLHHCPVSQAQAIAEQIRSAVVAYQLAWEGRHHSVGASIGLVPVRDATTTATEVLRAADAACYAAKRQGRNRVALHGPG
ncbi:MAG: diguanylate cyclase [Burkholderiales bacterium]|nr:diguanylate cyclase [Burkholderiales bacterium]